MSKPKLIAISVLTGLVLVIILQNTDSVETHLLFYPITMPLAVLLLGTAMLAFMAGVVVTMVVSKKRS